MNIAFDGDGHVRTALGLYFMGGLNDDEQSAIERHLAICEGCLEEYDRAGDVVSYLRYLTVLEEPEVEAPGAGRAHPVTARRNGALHPASTAHTSPSA
jgi:hypothetical protein